MRFFKFRKEKKKAIVHQTYKRPSKWEQNDYSHLRRERKISQVKDRFKQLAFILRYKRLILFVFAIVLLIFIGIPIFKNVPFYQIKNFEVSGNSQITTEQILTSLDGYKNKSLLTISTSEIEDKIVADNNYINKAYVRKKIPGTIEIEIVEEYPQRVLLNFSGAYILNDANTIIKVVETPSLQFNDYEYEILKGFGDFNADYVRERYLVDLEEDERQDVDWEKLDPKEKQNTLEKLEIELQTRVDTYVSNSFGILNNNNLGQLPVVIIYSSDEHKLRDNPESKKIIFTTKVITAFKKNNISFIRYEWISDYTLSVFTDDNKTILFSLIERDITDQLSDLDAIISKDLISQFKIIDLRTSTFTLKNL